MPPTPSRRRDYRGNRKITIIALVLVLALGCAYLSFLYVDQPVAQADREWTEGPAMQTAIRIAVWAGNWQLGPLLIAIVLIAGRDHWRRLLKTIAFAYLLRTALVEWLKMLTGRPRPYQLADASVFYGLGGGAAFPSGHASFTFMFAVIVGEWFPRWRWLAYSFAVYVSAFRVVNNAHFVSDVIVGAVIGVAMGLLALHLWPPINEDNRKRIEQEERAQRLRRETWKRSAEGHQAAARSRRQALNVLYVVLTIAAVVLAIFYIDPLRTPISSGVVQSAPVQLMGELGRVLGTWDIAPLLFAIVLLVAGWRWRLLLRALVVGYVVQTSVTEGLKWLIGRPRPRDIEDPWLFLGPGAGYASMPSGHASFAFMFAVIIGGFFPRARWPIYMFAVFIALSRIVLNAHYLSDVIAGALIGVLSGWLVLALWPPPDASRKPSKIEEAATADAEPEDAVTEIAMVTEDVSESQEQRVEDRRDWRALRLGPLGQREAQK